MNSQNNNHKSLLNDLVEAAKFNLEQLEKIHKEATDCESLSENDVLRQRAFALYYSRNDQAAVEALNRLVTIEPTADHYATLAMALLRVPRFVEAMEAANRTLELEDTNFWANLVLASASLARGEMTLALKHAQKAAELSTDPRGKAVLALAERYSEAAKKETSATLPSDEPLFWINSAFRQPDPNAWLSSDVGIPLVLGVDPHFAL